MQSVFRRLDLKMAESVSPTPLTVIEGWPYEEITNAFYKFEFGRPGCLMVGRSLWAILNKAYNSDEFLVCEVIPIKFDRSGILEPHEFMFTK